MWKYLVLFLVTVPAFAAAELTGVWKGRYFYGPKSKLESVPFEIRMRQSGEKITGLVIEPNTFGDSSAKELRASLQGNLDKNGELNFIKTYDGSGGASHSVRYKGKLEESSVKGTWHIGKSEGRFEMQLTETKKNRKAAKAK